MHPARIEIAGLLLKRHVLALLGLTGVTLRIVVGLRDQLVDPVDDAADAKFWNPSGLKRWIRSTRSSSGTTVIAMFLERAS